jgi:hypothetical protein
MTKSTNKDQRKIMEFSSCCNSPMINNGWCNTCDSSCKKRKTEKSNLWKIQEAFKINYSATVEILLEGTERPHETFNIVGIGGISVFTNNGGCISQQGIERSYVKITGYKYAGELAGNEPIPEGQKFRVKREDGYYNEIVTFNDMSDDNLRVCCRHDRSGLLWFDKSEIEPYFN